MHITVAAFSVAPASDIGYLAQPVLPERFVSESHGQPCPVASPGLATISEPMSIAGDIVVPEFVD